MSKSKAAYPLTLVLLALILASPASSYDEPVDTISGTLEVYTAVNSGLPTAGDYLFCTVGDVNGDGFDDIVASASNSSGLSTVLGLRVYTSKGGTGWEDNSTGLPTVDRYGGIGLGDVDGDGDLDIAAGVEIAEGSTSAGITIWLNDGTVGGRLSWSEGTSPETTWEYCMVVFADINADGDLDVVATTKGRGIRVWTGNGGAGGTLSWTVAGTGLPTYSMYTGITVADMNRDGDLDIVSCDYQDGGAEVNLWTGDGAGSWTSRISSFPAGSEATMGCTVGDVDGDGHMDIVYGRRNNAIKCLLGNSGGAGGDSFCWTAADTGLGTSGRYLSLDLADADLDGDLDLIAGQDGSGLQLFLGNGGAGGTMTWSLQTVGLPTGKFYGAVFGDFNKDRVPDVFGSRFQPRVGPGGLEAYRGTVLGASFPTARAVWIGSGANETSTVLGLSVTMDGRSSYDAEDAPDGDVTGSNLTYEWNLTSRPAASILTDADLRPSQNDSRPRLTPDALGDYTITLAVRDTDGHWSIDEALLSLRVLKPNIPPVADAGPDLTALTNETVVLNGNGSYDTDGVVTVHVWSPLPSNPDLVDLQGWNTSVASFVTPMTEGVYGFALRVMDDNGSWSEVDFVNVTVGLPPNVPPVARAGPDSAIVLGETIELNGTASHDPDGELVGWEWNCTSHAAIVIEGGNSSLATVVPEEPGRYVFTLRVQDDRGDWSAEDTVSVLVVAPDVNLPPVAVIAGPSLLETVVNSSVALDGSSSSDEDGAISEYLWNCTSHPGIAFDGQNTTVLRFTPAEDGDFVFTLTVRDDNGSWSLEEVSVTVRARYPPPPVNEPPVAVITGPGTPVEVDAVVTLTGSSSYDVDGELVDWGWECTSHQLTLTGLNTSMVRFTPGEEGAYTFSLRVRDDDGDWSPSATFTVEALEPNLPPVVMVLAPTDGELVEYLDVLYVAWEASDPNGDELVFHIRVWQMGELVREEVGIPGEVSSFNLTLLDPMGLQFSLAVTAEETLTDERLSNTSEEVVFWLVVDDILPEPDEEVEKAWGLLWLFLAITLIVIIVTVVLVVLFVVHRERAAIRMMPYQGVAAPQMAMCPQCSGAVDSDNAFGRPYCKRCDRYY